MGNANQRKLLSRLRQKAVRLKQKMRGKQFVHFLHIGKTGGTAIKHAIENWEDADSPYVIVLHPHRATLRDVPHGEHVVFFLRDPISRFVSGFYSRQRQGQPKYLSPWSPAETVAFEEFRTPNDLAVAISSSEAKEIESARQAMRSIAHVRDSYWKWLESEEYLRSRLADILFIGFQERLGQDFETLKSRLGLPATIHLPEGDLNAHRKPAELDGTLDDVAVANLKDWYRDDFRLIGLCNTIIHERQTLGDSEMAA